MTPSSATGADLTVATMNVEFLTRPKVHVKFGLPFDLSGADEAQWNAPGFRDQKFKEAADEIRAYLKAKPDAAEAANLRKLEEDWRARSKANKDQR